MALIVGGVAVDATAAEIDVLDGLDRGSIIYGNASSATTVLDQGGANEVLTSDGTDIAWAAAAGGGDVSKVGTPANNEVGIWTGDGTIEGDSNITYDGTTFTVNDAFAMGSGMQFGEIGRGTDTWINASTTDIMSLPAIQGHLYMMVAANNVVGGGSKGMVLIMTSSTYAVDTSTPASMAVGFSSTVPSGGTVTLRAQYNDGASREFNWVLYRLV
jgi:hypothetical protein